MSELRIGVVGVGGMGGQHASMYGAHPRAQVSWVCDKNEEAGTAKAGELGATFTSDYAEMLGREDVDAVLVSVPNPLHFPFALQALEAGKHVAIEYPMTQTAAQYDELCAAADSRGLVLQDILTPVFEAQPLKMIELAPRIGKIMTMRSVYIGGAVDKWYTSTQQRGNYFAGLTIHNIVYYNVLLGESPTWVDAALHCDDESRMHSGLYMSGYPSGVLAFNEWHMGSRKAGRWLWVVEGEKGRLVYDTELFSRDEIRLEAVDGDETFELGGIRGTAHEDSVAGFVAQVLDGSDEPYVTREFGRDTMRICEAAQRSADEGRRVYLNG
ncbi:MAG: Gfo/Idh/MocA family oxidoreductase [Lentisphaerae bacterium]|jgi:UDP-N-acetylglucosamine 3-dehydrogenase|nr:Gfo/Idh/MocA family oxidoreductase [Lentisphaerota bacterium]MBT4817826.1 Gfo/Idh/MocA family oxidoreductase [Lentisphaerota bacterium]MBT5604807.1 Gfo/Idh/MocA family oxidoreductase [Lentisphaerota bacterium]MBT7053558.1 Gfo/Idh/MocA family oxidoreductase [Lentisphaerota bacterium]MBT7843395.1 Gfo/Idh/MocA family oxidoreductase [Lentisphaerota bacterium]